MPSPVNEILDNIKHIVLPKFTTAQRDTLKAELGTIIYNTTTDEAKRLTERIGSVFDKERIRLARLGPVLGVHCGPDILFVALREK